MTENRIALIGDIIASRKISQRVAFDSILLTTMQELNKQNPCLLSQYTLIGDEIQAVFSSADSLFDDAIAILAAIHPERMRFSFGIGILVKPINPKQAIEMDGPAFHSARAGIDSLKQTGHLFIVKGEAVPDRNLLNYALQLISHDMRKWNRTRLQALAMLHRGLSVKEIATKLKVSDQAIYKTIDSGALETVKHLFGEVQDVLNKSVGDSE